MSIYDRIDKMAAEADWKDGMNTFRSKVSEELTKIYKSIAEIKQTINKNKETP